MPRATASIVSTVDLVDGEVAADMGGPDRVPWKGGAASAKAPRGAPAGADAPEGHVAFGGRGVGADAFDVLEEQVPAGPDLADRHGVAARSRRREASRWRLQRSAPGGGVRRPRRCERARSALIASARPGRRRRRRCAPPTSPGARRRAAPAAPRRRPCRRPWRTPRRRRWRARRRAAGERCRALSQASAAPPSDLASGYTIAEGVSRARRGRNRPGDAAFDRARGQT